MKNETFQRKVIGQQLIISRAGSCGVPHPWGASFCNDFWLFFHLSNFFTIFLKKTFFTCFTQHKSVRPRGDHRAGSPSWSSAGEANLNESRPLRSSESQILVWVGLTPWRRTLCSVRPTRYSETHSADWHSLYCNSTEEIQTGMLLKLSVTLCKMRLAPESDSNLRLAQASETLSTLMNKIHATKTEVDSLL